MTADVLPPRRYVGSVSGPRGPSWGKVANPLGPFEVSMKKPPAKGTGVPAFQDRPFLCPHCNMITAVETSVGYIDMKWVFCKHCHKQFVIRHDKPEKL